MNVCYIILNLETELALGEGGDCLRWRFCARPSDHNHGRSSEKPWTHILYTYFLYNKYVCKEFVLHILYACILYTFSLLLHKPTISINYYYSGLKAMKRRATFGRTISAPRFLFFFFVCCYCIFFFYLAIFLFYFFPFFIFSFHFFFGLVCFSGFLSSSKISLTVHLTWYHNYYLSHLTFKTYFLLQVTYTLTGCQNSSLSVEHSVTNTNGIYVIISLLLNNYCFFFIWLYLFISKVSWLNI